MVLKNFTAEEFEEHFSGEPAKPKAPPKKVDPPEDKSSGIAPPVQSDIAPDVPAAKDTSPSTDED